MPAVLIVSALSLLGWTKGTRIDQGCITIMELEVC